MVSPGGARSHKNIVMDVSQVTKIQVFLPGPTAITHLAICRDLSDTSSPSSRPSGEPSSLPSSSPSALPSLSPSAGPTSTICIPEAKLVDKSVADGVVGDYTSNPISIIYQGRSSVTFQVEQNWVAGDISWLAVNYEPADGAAPEVCHTTEALNDASSTPSYAAKCHNGFARIDVFAYDCSFVDVSNVIIPSSCESWSNDGKKAAFHFTVPCDPDPVMDGGSCDEPVCTSEARLVKKSVTDGTYGDVLSNPVNIVHYGVDTVTFRVEQNWKDGEISWISVDYKPADGSSETVCKSTEGVNHVSSTPDYTAKCSNGVAVIDIYAYDCTFTEVADIGGGVPVACQAWAGSGKTSHFRYTVPCDRMDKTYCTDEPDCIPEARTGFKSVTDGASGDFTSLPVTILRQGGSTVEFQVEQNWKDGDIGWIAVDYVPADQGLATTCVSTEAVGAGESTPSYTAVCVNGVAEIDVYAYDCTFTGVANIDATVPGTCQPFVDVGKKVHVHFTLPCLCVGGPSASSDKSTAVKTVSSKVAPTFKPVTLATNKLECGTDIFEDYETTGQSESWQHGSEYNDDAFTTFLGRLGRNHAVVSKVFYVPINSDYVDVTFDLYDIDGMSSSDKVFVGVQGSYLDLDLFHANGNKKYYNDIEVTGSTIANRRISFNFDKTDTIYAVTMRIPKYWYDKTGYKLPISFKIETAKDISEESYGVDNFRLHATCKRRQLDNEDGPIPPASESDESGDDGSFYCLSADFPCEGGSGMVNVCHYSTRKGYETFCIPETDSEILRFYAQDYCGPCVGGFGGVNMFQ